MAQDSTWLLVAVGGPHNGASYPLDERGVTLGRSDECEVVLASQNVSRKHARFFLYQDAPYVQDLGSRNGIFVNGTRVQQQVLRPGDSIAMGEFTFLISDGSVPVPGKKGPNRTVLIGGAGAAVVVVIALIAGMSGSGPSQRTEGTAQGEAGAPADAKSSEIKSMFDGTGRPGTGQKAGEKAPAAAPATEAQGAPQPSGDPTRNMIREYLDRAELLQEAGKYHEAREQLEKALRLDPGCQLCLTRRERLDREVAERVQKHLDDGMKAFNALRYEAAIHSWEMVINLSPDPGSQAHQHATRYIQDAQARMGGQSGY